MLENRQTYEDHVGQNVPIIIRIYGPARSGKSFVKKEILKMLEEKKDIFWYNPEIIVLENNHPDDERILEELKKKRHDL